MTYKMAMVVCFSTISTKPIHGVAFCHVLRMFFHVSLCAVPKGLNRLDIFVETQHKTVFLAIISHKFKWIIADIAEKLNTWLDAPIPFVIIHDGLPKEKPRLKATHMPVADRVPINNFLFSHLLPHLGSLILIDVIRERPMLMRDFCIVGRSRNERCRDFLESRVEWLVVEKDPIIVVISVESIFNLPNGFNDFP